MLKTKYLWVNFFLFISIFTHIERFCYHQTEGFQLSRIQANLPPEPAWEISPPDVPSLKKLLSQPFHFLGSGGQCYAFLSSDGNYVIKFFKHHHMRPDSFFFQKKHREKLHYVFQSCVLASTHLREETGILFTHLNRTTFFNQKLTLIDGLKISHEISLDDTSFILQKRGELLYTLLPALVEKREIGQAEQIISSLVDLLVIRCQRGIGDRDPHIRRNFAWTGTQVIDFDVGNFYLKPSLADPEVYKPRIQQELRKFSGWLQTHYPELAEILNKKLEQL